MLKAQQNLKKRIISFMIWHIDKTIEIFYIIMHFYNNHKMQTISMKKKKEKLSCYGKYAGFTM